MIYNHEFIGSSMLASCEYNDETFELTVTFHNGKSYTYEDVIINTYQDLISAPSAGSYFNSHKKNFKVKADGK